MIDKLLLVGVLEDDDVPKLLILIDPETWDSTFDRQVSNFVPSAVVYPSSNVSLCFIC